jgi:hypothetical protein
MSQFIVQNSNVEQMNDRGNNVKQTSTRGNNALTTSGSIVQTSGAHNAPQVDHKTRSFWSNLWQKVRALWTASAP